MPEFILDRGSAQGAKAFNRLDGFTQGYVEAMFFTECHSDNPELEYATVSDLSLEAWAAIQRDCDAFQLENEDALEEAYEHEDYGPENAGRDFWYTRNSHGVGFWDRGLCELGDRLSEAARCREVSLVLGDDGLLYLE